MTTNVVDPGLQAVQEQLQNIENIMKAEQKRRTEANEALNDFILGYLDSLQDTLS
jgi:hypothetical protein